MDEQLQKELAEWLASIRGTASEAKGIIVEQGPEVAAEFVAFGRAKETGQLCLLLVVAVLTIAVWRRVLRGMTWDRFQSLFDGSDDQSGPFILGVFLTAPLAILLPIAISITAYWAAMAWLAPRLYILYKIAEFAS